MAKDTAKGFDVFGLFVILGGYKACCKKLLLSGKKVVRKICKSEEFTVAEVENLFCNTILFISAINESTAAHPIPFILPAK